MEEQRPIPTSWLGDIRGLFEIFLPGLFLLLNFVPLIYCGSSARSVVLYLGENPVKAALFVVPAAYVLGLGLRLARTHRADRVSGFLSLWISGGQMVASAAHWLALKGPELEEIEEGATLKKKEKIWKKLLRSEHFPYPHLIRSRTAQRLPPEALEFCESLWATEARDDETRSGIFRFDFFKIMVSSADKRAAREIYNAEILVRHAANMCYALFCSALLLLSSALFPSASVLGLRAMLLYMAVGEALVLLVVLLNLRLLRVAEVELVFTCCFIHRGAIAKALAGDPAVPDKKPPLPAATAASSAQAG